MADADVQITAGSGTKVDTRTVGTGTDEHRQVVVIGDPTTAANVVDVDANGATKTRLVDGSGTAIAPDAPLPVYNVPGEPRVETLVVSSTGQQGSIPLSGITSVTATLIGTWSGNIILQGSWDGELTWTNLSGLNANGEIESYSLTGNGHYWYHGLNAFSHLRLNSTISSGSATVVLVLQTGALAGVVASSSIADFLDTDGHFYGPRLAAQRGLVVAPLQSLALALGDNVSAALPFYASDGSDRLAAVGGYTFDGTNWDRLRQPTADAMAVTGLTASGLMGFNGTTWDRVRGDVTNGLDVDVTRLPSGTVAGASSLPAGTNNIGDVDVLTIPAPLSTAGNGTAATAQRVTLASDSTGVVAVTGSLPAGTNAIGKLAANSGVDIGDVDVTSVPAPHVTGSTALSIAAAYTATQTSTNLIAGTGGQRIYVTNITIATGGTTAGRVSIYYGTGAFTAGTSVTLFDGEFAPSATARPGAVLTFAIPVGGASATGDNLRITTSAGITVYVTGQAYKA